MITLHIIISITISSLNVFYVWFRPQVLDVGNQCWRPCRAMSTERKPRRRRGRLGAVRDIVAGCVRGSRFSNTTCLTQVFFTSGE